MASSPPLGSASGDEQPHDGEDRQYFCAEELVCQTTVKRLARPGSEACLVAESCATDDLAKGSCVMASTCKHAKHSM
jgi:hypothetical protein